MTKLPDMTIKVEMTDDLRKRLDTLDNKLDFIIERLAVMGVEIGDDVGVKLNRIIRMLDPRLATPRPLLSEMRVMNKENNEEPIP